MKKLLALILSLVCIFALAFTACTDDSDGNSGDPNNNEQTGGNDENGDNGGNEQTGGNQGNEDDEQHKHIFKTTWSYDGQNHWHEATCHPNEKKDVAPHTYVNGKCSECKREELYDVGDMLPDFTVETFGGDNFSSADARGKVLVINFWYVNCGPCVDEIPKMEKIVSENYSDEVTVIALHSSGPAHAGDLAVAPTFINNKGWSNYGMIFGKDNGNEDLYKVCGGDGNYPLTVILNSEGEITFIKEGYLIYLDVQTMQNVDFFTPALEAALGR